MVLPSHGFIQQQQRGQASFPFGTSLQQHPPSQAHQPTPSSLAHATAQQQQPGAGATTSSLPPHLQGGAAGGGGGAPGLGNAQSGSSGNDVGLDPNDFPALGSGSTGANAGAVGATNSPVTTLASSYASQAGTGGASATQANSSGGTGTSNGPRDFTADDFPALGGQSSTQQPSTQRQPQTNQAEGNGSHPPGLNGFENRQQPGLINLGAQRGIPQPQGDAEKRVSILSI